MRREASRARVGDHLTSSAPDAEQADAFPDPVLFVGGSQRSGTTLLRNMLTAHPALAVPDESPFVHTIRRRLEREGRNGDMAEAWRLIRATDRFKLWNLEPELVEAVLAERPARSYPDLVRALFATYARSRGKPHSADKTTGNALAFEWLAEHFPGSRFVHVVRDPREVCMSLAVQWWNRDGLAGAARAWRTHVAAAHAAAGALGSRMLELRYEDLVERPREQLERLCAFAGLPFDAAMLDYGHSPEALPRHDQDLRAREPLHPGARPWRAELSRDDVALIEHIAGPVMEAVGYPRALARPTPRARVAIARERARGARAWWMRHGARAIEARVRARRERQGR